MKAYLEQLYDYNVWANGLILKFAEQLPEERLQGLPGRPSSELARRPLPDRFADSENHCRGSDRRKRSCVSPVRAVSARVTLEKIAKGVPFEASARIRDHTAWQWTMVRAPTLDDTPPFGYSLCEISDITGRDVRQESLKGRPRRRGTAEAQIVETGGQGNPTLAGHV